MLRCLSPKITEQRAIGMSRRAASPVCLSWALVQHRPSRSDTSSNPGIPHRSKYPCPTLAGLDGINKGENVPPSTDTVPRTVLYLSFELPLCTSCARIECFHHIGLALSERSALIRRYITLGRSSPLMLRFTSEIDWPLAKSGVHRITRLNRGPTSVPETFAEGAKSLFQMHAIRELLDSLYHMVVQRLYLFCGGGPHAVQCSAENHAGVCHPGRSGSSSRGDLLGTTC